MNAIDDPRATLASLAGAIRARKISPVEITRSCLERIATLDPRLNAFVTVTADRALADATRAEREIGRGRWRGPLHGVPIAVKDIFATRGIRTTCGSRVLRDWVPDDDATVVRRLARAGSVLLGKLNMSEFAYAGVHPDVGPPRNPWNLDRFTGGSSSGSGAAVAAGLCFGSVGTDTGGSIRGPAAHCGIVGLKPTYGLVSRAGVVPLSWSLDHAGPMARTSEDAAILLEAILGFDAADPTSALRRPAEGRERPLRALARDVRRLRVGVVREFLGGGTQPDIASRVAAAVEALGPLVRSVDDVSLPHADELVPAWTAICVAEAAAYHERTLAQHPEDYGELVRDRLLAGLAVPAVEYLQAQRVRRTVTRAFAALFERVDLLVLPSMLAEAPTIEAATSTHGAWQVLMDRIRSTAPANLTGLPAVSVPCGFTSSGLPVGLQLVGRHFADRMVLAAAHAYERRSGWTTRRPAVSDMAARPAISPARR
jgi:aspartyl-tRNA(Asn)/glutamyl-tRNA(Gln) amidotransferase subunit A